MDSERLTSGYIGVETRSPRDLTHEELWGYSIPVEFAIMDVVFKPAAINPDGSIGAVQIGRELYSRNQIRALDIQLRRWFSINLTEVDYSFNAGLEAAAAWLELNGDAYSTSIQTAADYIRSMKK